MHLRHQTPTPSPPLLPVGLNKHNYVTTLTTENEIGPGYSYVTGVSSLLIELIKQRIFQKWRITNILDTKITVTILLHDIK